MSTPSLSQSIPLEVAHKRIGELEQQIQDSQQLKTTLEERLRFETLLSKISSVYSNLPATEVDHTIEYGLQQIGEFLGADRCNLVQFPKTPDSDPIVHWWVQTGTEPLPTLDKSIGKLFPWFAEKFRRGEVARFTRLEDLPPEAEADRNAFAALGTKSQVSVPIKVGGTPVGTLSIATVRTHHSWPDDLAQRLRLLGEIFANAVVRKQKELEIEKAFAQIEKLNTQLEAECTYLREEIETEYDFHKMIGQSEALKTVFQKISQVGPTDVSVLVYGETGTGKELIARAIHAASQRKDRPMVKVNCAALPANLIESELFGHEKGAFTSAQSKQIGRFELADGSTIFLDEIGELPLESQAKLLRVLQEGEFERLGSSRTLKIDVRIIAATNRNLADEVKKGRFRQDLWYRLNVFPITSPPLRERREDIPLLVNWFVIKSGKKLGKTIERIPAKVMQELQNYPWPGNVRELENILERAVINSAGKSLQLLDKLEPPQSEKQKSTAHPTLEELERNYIVQILEETNGRIEGPKGAAAILGLHPSTLRGRMRKLQIQINLSID